MTNLKSNLLLINRKNNQAFPFLIQIANPLVYKILKVQSFGKSSNAALISYIIYVAIQYTVEPFYSKPSIQQNPGYNGQQLWSCHFPIVLHINLFFYIKTSQILEIRFFENNLMNFNEFNNWGLIDHPQNQVALNIHLPLTVLIHMSLVEHHQTGIY